MDSHGLVEGATYNRRGELHPRFGGSWQSGIAPAPKSKVILIFSGEEGHEFGYEDEWDAEGQTFIYTGEGQNGDMTFTKGNKAIRDHVKAGRALLLFEKIDRSGLYRFVGEMQCAGTSEAAALDKTGKIRKVLKFQLVRLRAAETPLHQEDEFVSLPATLTELRNLAYQAVLPRTEAPTLARRNLYKRSQTVAQYALARANGCCEGCANSAPFNRANGTPYLEVHHIERLSDGGLDAPEHVIAVCPTCHRRAHFSADRETFNASLREKVRHIEHMAA